MKITTGQAARIIVSDCKDFISKGYGTISPSTVKQMIAEFCEYGDTERKRAITTLVMKYL